MTDIALKCLGITVQIHNKHINEWYYIYSQNSSIPI